MTRWILRTHPNLFPLLILAAVPCAATTAQAEEPRVRMALGLGATSPSWGVAFSPDGKRLAFSSDRGTIIWDLGPVQKATLLRGHQSGAACIAFAPDGKTVATGSYDKTAILWDAQTGQELARVRDFPRDVYTVAFTADGKTLCMSDSEGLVKCLDVASRKVTRTFKEFEAAHRIAFNRGAEMLVFYAGFRDYTTFNAWDMKAHKRVKGPVLGRFIKAVACSADSKLIATCNQDSLIQVWDVATMKPLHRLSGHSLDLTATLAFRPDGKVLASGGDDKTLRLWDLQAGKEIRAFDGLKSNIRSLCFSPDGKQLAVVAGEMCLLLDAETLRTIELFRGHTRRISALGLSADGKVLASAAEFNPIRFWDLTAGREKRVVELPEYTHPSHLFPLGDRTVLAYDRNRGLNVWDATTGKARKLCDPVGEVALASTRDYSRVAVGARKFVTVWNPTTAEQVARFEHPGAVATVGFSPDGKVLLTGCAGVVRKWELATGKKLAEVRAGLATPEAGYSCCFSPDGRLLAAPDETGPGRVKVWDTTTGKQVAFTTRGGTSVRSLCFSPDSKRLAWADFTRVRVYDVREDRDLAYFEGRTNEVSAVIFLNSRTLASGGVDTGILVWELP